MENSIRRIIEAHLRQNLSTAIPAKVESVEFLTTKQVIDVAPLINRVYEDGTVLNPATITDVPLVFPSAGGGVLSFPIKVGDTVLLVYSMRSLDEWTNSDGTTQTPIDARHFNKSDAIAIPGLYTNTAHLSPNATDVELKFTAIGTSLRLEATTGDVVIENPTHSLKLKSNGDVLHSSGAKITAAGDFITAAGVSLDNHTHAQANDSDGNTQVETNSPT